MDSQIKSVKEYGCEKIFQEKVSGTSTKGRDKLRECLEFVREGDELVITRVDRAARSVLDLQLIIKELTDKGVSLTATEQPISTKFKGRVAKIDVNKIQSLKDEGLGATEIARQMGIERTSVYRLLKKVKVSS